MQKYYQNILSRFFMFFMFFVFLLFCIFIILLVYRFFIDQNIYKKLGVEAFSNSWTDDLKKRFLDYQKTINENNNQFDLNVLQSQVTPEEVETYLKTGYWNWSDDLIKQYLIEVGNNKIIKLDPGVSLNYAMRLYNQNAIKEILAWNTKEGQFLLNGVDLGVSSNNNQQYNSISNPHNTIKCSTDSIMEKTVYNGINKWNGYPNKTVIPLKNEDLPKEIPGFSFIHGPCNPCTALNYPADYSCPFNNKVKEIGHFCGVSNIWHQLWNL
jgi:hypothetical protein